MSVHILKYVLHNLYKFLNFRVWHEFYAYPEGISFSSFLRCPSGVSNRSCTGLSRQKIQAWRSSFSEHETRDRTYLLRVDIPGGAQRRLLLHNVQTGSDWPIKVAAWSKA
jgi:hypothetical protein